MKTIEEKAKEYGGSLTITRETQKTVTREDFEQAFLAGAQAVQEWISVDDELPKRQGSYLVKVKAMGEFFYDVKVWDTDFEDWFSTVNVGTVTHWRPIECK